MQYKTVFVPLLPKQIFNRCCHETTCTGTCELTQALFFLSTGYEERAPSHWLQENE